MTFPFLPPPQPPADVTAVRPPETFGPLLQALAPQASPLPPTPSELRDRVVLAAAQRHGVPPTLALAVSHVENWRGLPRARSKAGAVGIMQVMPNIHGPSATELEDPEVNAETALRLLRRLYDRHGDWDKALRAYNGALKLPKAGDRYVA